MTFSRWSRLIETLEGAGKVIHSDKAVADVKYSLRVEEEDLVAKSFNMKVITPLNTITKISGNITTVKGDIAPYIGTRDNPAILTLNLEDGRELDFSVVDSSPIDGNYLIKGIGEFTESSK